MPTRHRRPTVGDVPRHYARSHPDAGRAVLIADDARYTWSQIDDASSRLANVVLSLGLAPDAKVAVLMTNRVEYVEIMYGIAKAGCTIVPLNSRYTAREITHGVNFAEAEALITSPDMLETMAAALPGMERISEKTVLVVDEHPQIGASYPALLRRSSPADPGIDVDEDSVYWMPFTSGTTADPKAAMVTHRALIDHWRVVIHEFEVTRDDTMLIAGPFYHSLGFLFGLTSLFAGGTMAIHSSFDPDRVLTAIQDLRATVTPMVPTMYTMLLARPHLDCYDLGSMRAVISAGSPSLTGTKNGLIDLFGTAGLYEFYGSTEIGVASVLDPADQQRKVRCVGLPAFGSRLQLLDPEGNEVPQGESGEIHKRGLLLGAEYFRNPEATESMYHGEWAATGDVGRFDDEGYLYIEDRTKDMIITGGVNVFPSEIEEVISRHPGVLEVAVIGLPDETWGESITAFIVPGPGSSPPLQEILRLCESELASYKKPRRVEFVDELPKTGTGKVLKRRLRDRR